MYINSIKKARTATHMAYGKMALVSEIGEADRWRDLSPIDPVSSILSLSGETFLYDRILSYDVEYVLDVY